MRALANLAVSATDIKPFGGDAFAADGYYTDAAFVTDGYKVITTAGSEKRGSSGMLVMPFALGDSIGKYTALLPIDNSESETKFLRRLMTLAMMIPAFAEAEKDGYTFDIEDGSQEDGTVDATLAGFLLVGPEPTAAEIKAAKAAKTPAPTQAVQFFPFTDLVIPHVWWVRGKPLLNAQGQAIRGKFSKDIFEVVTGPNDIAACKAGTYVPFDLRPKKGKKAEEEVESEGEGETVEKEEEEPEQEEVKPKANAAATRASSGGAASTTGKLTPAATSSRPVDQRRPRPGSATA